ncbi:hypothetical protein EYF80_061747 [Liparis tanakae]|uniref:Uncharacterized protein n=1 Tax=Liparis tanakae TaxID=230148 RepID=A0A4Z2EH88_9TELE|nr:hypothetical protein EYF80_061747 [Liparis tanakae]
MDCPPRNFSSVSRDLTSVRRTGGAVGTGAASRSESDARSENLTTVTMESETDGKTREMKKKRGRAARERERERREASTELRDVIGQKRPNEVTVSVVHTATSQGLKEMTSYIQSI